MTFILPKPAIIIDNIFLNQDVNNLYQKILIPIDKLRSISIPGKSSISNSNTDNKLDALINRDFQGLTTDIDFPTESRVHCFYRMMGFPAIINNNSFFSPGFNPSQKQQTNITNFDTNIISILEKREDYYRSVQNLFKNQSKSSVIYSILLIYCRKFNIFQNGGNSLQEDLQTQLVDARVQELNDLNQYLFLQDYVQEAKSQSIDFTNPKHLLKPFVIHPRITNVISPDFNQLLAGFLPVTTFNKIKIGNQTLLRSGLEYILLQKLNGAKQNTTLMQNFNRLLNTSTNTLPSAISSDQLKADLSALVTNNKLDDQLYKNLLKTFSSVELDVIEKLTQTLQFLAETLVKEFQKISAYRQQIDWLPLKPNIRGPEIPSDYQSMVMADSNKLLELRILHSQALFLQLQTQASDSSDYMDNIFSDLNFTTSLNNALNTLQRYKKTIFLQLSESAAIIEKISGEISGLGLMDCISIYLACWSLSSEDILGLLDAAAIDRLTKNFPSVASSINTLTKTDFITALGKIEEKVGNIFTYVDKLIENQL